MMDRATQMALAILAGESAGDPNAGMTPFGYGRNPGIARRSRFADPPIEPTLADMAQGAPARSAAPVRSAPQPDAATAVGSKVYMGFPGGDLMDLEPVIVGSARHKELLQEERRRKSSPSDGYYEGEPPARRRGAR